MNAKLLRTMKLVIVGILATTTLTQAIPALETTGYLPQFEKTKPNLKALEESLTKTSILADVLKKGNDELSEAIKAYQNDPTIDAKDRVYLLLGNLAGKTVNQIEDIISNKDRMKDGLSEITYKMDHIKISLNEKQQKFNIFADEIAKKAQITKDELRKLAKAIKKDPENKDLRRQFRRKLFALRNLDHRNKTYLAHQRLNKKFGEQVELAQQFFSRLDNNMDQMILNLQEQKEFLVMRVALLKDAAEMESWLRDESESNTSAFAMMKKIGELSKALGKFDAAADVLVEMTDIGTLIDSLPDASEILGFEGGTANGANFEDKYVEYFSKE